MVRVKRLEFPRLATQEPNGYIAYVKELFSFAYAIF